MKKTKTVLCLILCLAFFALFALGSGESSSTSSKSTYSKSNNTSYGGTSSLTYSTTTGKKKTCIACHGSGRVQQWYTNDPDEEPHWETCNACHGLGYYYE